MAKGYQSVSSLSFFSSTDSYAKISSVMICVPTKLNRAKLLRQFFVILFLIKVLWAGRLLICCIDLFSKPNISLFCSNKSETFSEIIK